MGEGARGPTILDTTDIYGTNVKTISFMFMISSIGSLVGAFFSELQHSQVHGNTENNQGSI